MTDHSENHQETSLSNGHDTSKDKKKKKEPEIKVDLVNRDPNGLNEHVSVLFEDVIAEPDGAHSANCVWIWSYRCFSGALRVCYMALSFVCALPTSACWGCTFACISFSHIWHFTPLYKALSINLLCLQRFYAVFINCLLVPCIEAQALIFSRIRVSINKD